MPTPDDPPQLARARAQAALQRAHVAAFLGHYDAAEQAFADAHAIAQELMPFDGTRFEALFGLVGCSLERGCFTQALMAVQDDSLACLAEGGGPGEQVLPLDVLTATVLARAGAPADALLAFTHIQERLSDLCTEHAACVAINAGIACGRAHLDSGDPGAAVETVGRVLPLTWQHSHGPTDPNRVLALYVLCDAHLAHGDCGAAEAVVDELASLTHRAPLRNYVQLVVGTTVRQGALSLAAGALEDAASCYQRAEAVCQEAGWRGADWRFPGDRTEALLGQAAVAEARGDAAAAAERYLTAATHLSETGRRQGPRMGPVLAGAERALRAAGRIDAAETTARTAASHAALLEAERIDPRLAEMAISMLICTMTTSAEHPPEGSTRPHRASSMNASLN